MTKEIIIEGMMCNGCVKRVTQALNEIGISDVSVDLETKKATINTDSEIDNNALKETIEDLGFDVLEIK